jgi:hypothetical protein
MKNYSYFLPIGLLAAFLFVSCSVEEIDIIDETSFDVDQTLSSNRSSDNTKGNSKIDICHYNKGTNSLERITISINALSAHDKHEKDIINFDDDGDGYPVENECGINFRADGLWDLDDNDPTIQDELDCFSHIIGHYSASKHQLNKDGEDISFELDFTVLEEGEDYFIRNGKLIQIKTNLLGVITSHKEFDVNLKIHSVNEMSPKNYSFRFDENYPIDSGSGYYSCDVITITIGIAGAGISGLQGFHAVKTD